ncbi:MAG: MFS transporter [Planctomycetes bacterium]|nr:MFS transporter [Planctomycetota bacterium]
MSAMRFLIMAWLFLAGVIGSGLIGPNRSAVLQEYGLSETQFGAGVASVQIVAATAVLAGAHWLARLRPVTVLMMGLVVMAAGFGAISATHHLPGLIVGWALVTAALALGAIANNISMDLWPDDPHRGVVLLHSFNAGGKVVGPLIAAAFLAAGYRRSFITVGALVLAVLAAFIALRRRSAAADTGALVDPGSGLEVLRQGRFWAFMLWIGMIAGGEGAFATLLPRYVEKTLGQTVQVGTLALTVHLLGLTAGRFAAAFAGRTVRPGAVIAVCLGAGVFIFPALLTRSLPILFVSLFLLGVMFSSTWPSFYAVATRWLPGALHMMPYGSSLGSFAVMAACIFLSSVIADRSLALSLYFGPAVLWAFGATYLLAARAGLLGVRATS